MRLWAEERNGGCDPGSGGHSVCCPEQYGSSGEYRRITPEQFGAKGDGIADDLQALQAAMRQCQRRPVGLSS